MNCPKASKIQKAYERRRFIRSLALEDHAVQQKKKRRLNKLLRKCFIFPLKLYSGQPRPYK